MHGTAKIDRTKNLFRSSSGALYFRVKQQLIAELPCDQGSDEFKAAYDRLAADRLAGKFGKIRRAGRPSQLMQPARPPKPAALQREFKPPQIGYYLAKWLASDFFADPGKPRPLERPYAAGTQINYRNAIELLRSFKLAGGEAMARMPLDGLTPKLARLYIAKFKARHGGAQAKTQVSILSKLWQFALSDETFDEGDRPNPMRGGEIPQPYTTRQEHRDWPKPVIEAFLHACDENLTLAFWLLLCTGQRIGDVVRLQWSQIEDGCLTLTQQKTGEPMSLKLPKKLVALLARRERTSAFVLTHAWGEPYTRDSLGHRIKDVLREVAPNGKTAPSGLPCSDYTAHGLRKNAGIMLALNGANIAVIMACLGHVTEKMAVYYTRLASRKALAAQGADIMDAVFEREDGARAAAMRARIRAVK